MQGVAGRRVGYGEDVSSDGPRVAATMAVVARRVAGAVMVQGKGPAREGFPQGSNFPQR